MEKGIKKDDVIKHSLLLMGFPLDDADSKEAEVYKTASFLFDGTLLKMLKDNTFPFNIYKERINYTDRKFYLGKYEYVKPSRYLDSLTPGVEERGDKLYSTKENLILRYKKKLDAIDVPEEYGELLSILLAIKTAPGVGKVKSLTRLYSLYQEELMQVSKLGSYDITLEELE